MHKKLLFLFWILMITGWVSAQDFAFNGLDFSGQWFLGYQVDDAGKPGETNAFLLKRGYVTVQKQLNKHLSARITQDIAVDHEGDGEGDIEIRLKYGYLRYTSDLNGFISKPFIEFGLVHRPWLDFEQKINHYRVQGTMFLERIGMLRSADYGLTIGGMLGGEIDDDFQKSVNSSYPGKYGSFSVGIYNGGGYEAIENNKNKLIETRFSYRPLPVKLPGFQMSWIGAVGKGNIAESPDYFLNSIYLSYDSPWFTLSGTYFNGRGNLIGNALDESGKSYDHDGYSVFSEICVPSLRLCPVVRYDHCNLSNQATESRYILGIAYNFFKNSKILFDVDLLKTNGRTEEEFMVYEFMVEFKY